MLLPRFLLQLSIIRSIIRSIIPTTRVGAGQDRPNISPCLFLRLIRDDHRLHLLLHLTLSTDLPDIETLMIMSISYPPCTLNTPNKPNRNTPHYPAFPHCTSLTNGLPPTPHRALLVHYPPKPHLALALFNFVLSSSHFPFGPPIVLVLALGHSFHRTLQYSIYSTYIRHSFVHSASYESSQDFSRFSLIYDSILLYRCLYCTFIFYL